MIWEGKGRLTTKTGRRERLGDYLVPREIRWSVDGDAGAPSLHMRFEMRDGRPECVEVHLMASDDGRGLRWSDLAGFHLDTITTGVFQETASPIVEEDDGHVAAIGGASIGEREWWTIRDTVEERVKSSRGPSKAELEEVASVYRRHPGAPLKAVQTALGYTERTAARRVKAAREAGLIDPKEGD